MTLRTAAVVTIAVVVAAACATSPTGRRQLRLVSDTEMSQMGVAAFQKLKTETPPTQNGKVNSYVQCVAGGITREVGGAWEVQVFESKDVNAFALPGGKIGVYTGLLKVTANQSQLAAVIGHEVSHVLAGHSASRVSNEMAAQLGVSVLNAQGSPDGSPIGQRIVGLLVEEMPARGQCDAGAVVTPHAVDSQSSHGIKCRTDSIPENDEGPRCDRRSRAFMAVGPGQASFLVLSTLRPR